MKCHICGEELGREFVNIEFLTEDEQDVETRSVCVKCAMRVVEEHDDA